MAQAIERGVRGSSGGKMSILDKVGEALAFGRQEELRLIGKMPARTRAANGSVDEWSPRDNLIHLAVWKLILVQAMEEPAVAPLDPRPEETDAVNRTVYLCGSGLNWRQAEDFLAHAHRRTMLALQRYSAEALQDVDLLPWLGGQPLWRRLLGSAVMHPVFHYALIYQQIGLAQEGLRLQERMLLYLDAVSPDKGWLGVGRYNLACAYALKGEKERALEWLAEGLRLRPDLAEYSKTDADLAALHGDSRYLALVNP